MSKRKVILVILDGWGIGEADESNPIHVVKPKNIYYLRDNFPAGILQASGISVGLPWGEEGNSEVGHLNMGAGKIIYQNYPRISLAVRDESFFKIKALKAAFEHARKNKSSVNLIGLLSQGNVHASLEHLLALIKFCEQEKIPFNLHLFTDGRDSPPYSAAELLARLPQGMKPASLSGRFYAMDREKHWERTQKTYSNLVSNKPTTKDIKAHLKETYDRKLNDEYIEPILLGNPVKENDALIFFNFREDRIRQLTAAFIEKDFKNFPIKKFSNLYVCTMTEYDKDFKVPVAFPPQKIQTCLGKVLEENGSSQMRIAETQKYPHITYFFNGMREEPFKNEYRILIPSKMVIRQAQQPEMMAAEITSRAVESIGENVFDFILINYANPDIIAHTGDYQASLKAVKIVDEQIAKITKAVLGTDSVLILTSDHGNMERLFDPQTGMPETQHNISPVPIYIVGNEFKRKKTAEEIRQCEIINTGLLADVAPTILELMGLPKPKEMTGQSLLRFLV